MPDPSTIAALFDVDLVGWITSFICLATAFVLGMLIGLERQWRQRNAGLRTNVLVAVGAAAFADLGLRMAGADGGSGSFPRWFRASAFWGPGSS
jgi:putative Mg2+ transporter-C (MgtC) family protein